MGASGGRQAKVHHTAREIPAAADFAAFQGNSLGPPSMLSVTTGSIKFKWRESAKTSTWEKLPHRESVSFLSTSVSPPVHLGSSFPSALEFLLSMMPTVQTPAACPFHSLSWSPVLLRGNFISLQFQDLWLLASEAPHVTLPHSHFSRKDHTKHGRTPLRGLTSLQATLI